MHLEQIRFYAMAWSALTTSWVSHRDLAVEASRSFTVDIPLCVIVNLISSNWRCLSKRSLSLARKELFSCKAAKEPDASFIRAFLPRKECTECTEKNGMIWWKKMDGKNDGKHKCNSSCSFLWPCQAIPKPQWSWCMLHGATAENSASWIPKMEQEKLEHLVQARSTPRPTVLLGDLNQTWC